MRLLNFLVPQLGEAARTKIFPQPRQQHEHLKKVGASACPVPRDPVSWSLPLRHCSLRPSCAPRTAASSNTRHLPLHTFSLALSADLSATTIRIRDRSSSPSAPNAIFPRIPTFMFSRTGTAGRHI